jgi:hypothetical protein
VQPGLLLATRRVLCAALLTAFLFFSVPTVIRGLGGSWAGPIQPFHSSDAYLQAVTGTPRSSQRVIDLLAGLPAEKPILIFVREKDSGSSLLGMSMAYLAWPHDVQIMGVVGADCSEQLAKVVPGSVSALAFCDLRPPSWIPEGIRLGPEGRLVRFIPPVPTK